MIICVIATSGRIGWPYWMEEFVKIVKPDTDKYMQLMNNPTGCRRFITIADVELKD